MKTLRMMLNGVAVLALVAYLHARQLTAAAGGGA
jgi:hypothetical protein